MLTTMYNGEQEIMVSSNRIEKYKLMGWALEKSEPKKVVSSTPAPKKAETTVKTSGTESK